MSRSYTSSPPSASMACSGTALLFLLLFPSTVGSSQLVSVNGEVLCFFEAGIELLNDVQMSFRLQRFSCYSNREGDHIL
jgi:hypothetical protein